MRAEGDAPRPKQEQFVTETSHKRKGKCAFQRGERWPRLWLAQLVGWGSQICPVVRNDGPFRFFSFRCPSPNKRITYSLCCCLLVINKRTRKVNEVKFSRAVHLTFPLYSCRSRQAPGEIKRLNMSPGFSGNNFSSTHTNRVRTSHQPSYSIALKR